MGAQVLFDPSFHRKGNETRIDDNRGEPLAALVVPAGMIWVLGPWAGFSGKQTTSM